MTKKHLIEIISTTQCGDIISPSKIAFDDKGTAYFAEYKEGGSQVKGVVICSIDRAGGITKLINSDYDIHFSPKIYNNSMYYGTDFIIGNKGFSYDLNGNLLWDTDIVGALLREIISDTEGNFIFATNEPQKSTMSGHLFSINQLGYKNWSCPIGVAWFGPIITNNSILLGEGDNISAFSMTGERLWQLKTGTLFSFESIVNAHNKYLHVPVQENQNIAILSVTADGKIINKFSLPCNWVGCTYNCVSDETLYLVDYYRFLNKISLTEGKILARVKLRKSTISAPKLLASGNILLPSSAERGNTYVELYDQDLCLLDSITLKGEQICFNTKNNDIVIATLHRNEGTTFIHRLSLKDI